MKTNPAKALFQIVASLLSNPAAHGHPACPSISRIQIDFDGYQGGADFIGGDLFRSASMDRNPIASDQAEALLNTRTIYPEGRTTTVGEILDEAIETHLAYRHPGWNCEVGAYGNLDIRFESASCRHGAPPQIRIGGKITRRILTSRTSKI